jgi:hypothetical protein
MPFSIHQINRYPRVISGLLLICIAVPVAAAPGRILDRIEVEQADTSAFVSEAEVFKSIGLSIALSIAHCQGQEDCEPVVDKEELDVLIGKLDDRINRLVIKHQDGAVEYADVLTAYVNQRESYLEYQKKLEALLPSAAPEPVEEVELTDTLEEPPAPAAGEEVDLSVFEDVDEALFEDSDEGLENFDPDLDEDLGEDLQ